MIRFYLAVDCRFSVVDCADSSLLIAGLLILIEELEMLIAPKIVALPWRSGLRVATKELAIPDRATHTGMATLELSD